MKTRDSDIRNSLHRYLRTDHEDAETLIVDELSLCQGDARIDVAVVNGAINGYEIKSESDTLMRLPKQCEIYSQVFDTVTILSASKYVDDIVDIVPSWWGIIKTEMDCDGILHFMWIRSAQKNPEINPFALVQLLWREEALGILKEKGLQRGYLSKPKIKIWTALAEEIPLQELQDAVRAKLKERRNWRGQ